MSLLFASLRALLDRSLPSWTVWLSVAWAVISGLPEVLTTVIGWFGTVTPELTAQVVAFTLLLARLRSIAGPIILGLLGKSEDKEA